ncbi:RNA polymerase sigma factor [Nocardioides caldifontis]|uniref:RNA polymerase sigma factor n=1 Tax=Nocardioides caldifontis TaxID=2588938 RepID=UPI001396806E|nr:sigma-70 family RNA polymerase sigma factor [Nocardioides caldifontis]
MEHPVHPDYEWVFRTTYPAVVRTAFVIVRERGLAEEVAQDAFVRLYERWDGIEPVEQPQAWVHAVAVRMAVRQARRRRTTSVVDLDDRPVDDPVVDVDLHRALGELPPRQRAAVALYYLEDRPVAEVALLLDVSPSTVKQHLHRARARLAVLLGEETEVAGDVG